MNQKFSKALLSTLALGMMSGMFADTTSTKSSSSDDAMQSRVITPNAGPRVSNGADVYLTADFIYWTARQDGLAYSRTGIITPTEATAGVVVQNGSTQFPPTKFSPGFKVGAGLNLGHDGWDTYLQYTWFQTSQSNTSNTLVTDSTVQPQRPLWDTAGIQNSSTDPDSIDLIGYESATGKWSLRFNNFDLELGRNFYVSQYLTLRPHAGFKGCWYDQNYRVNYSDLTQTVSSTVLTYETARLKMDQDFWGFGIRTGMDAAWYFTKNWCFFSEASVALLWGQFQVARKDSLVDTTTDPATVYSVVNSAQSFHTVKPVLETAFGVRFDYWFSDDNYHFGIDASWEEQLWMNQNQFFKLFDGHANFGDLSFQGFTLRVRFDF